MLREDRSGGGGDWAARLQMALLLLSALQLQLVLLPSALGATAPAPPQLPDAIATSPAGTFKGFTENGTNVSRAPTETNRNQPKRLRPATPLLGAAVATREMPPLRPPVQVWRGIPKRYQKGVLLPVQLYYGLPTAPF
eukprot:SAG31_NODE_1225_length_9271_cov_10.376472_3_plen_138_part_00